MCAILWTSRHQLMPHQEFLYCHAFSYKCYDWCSSYRHESSSHSNYTKHLLGPTNGLFLILHNLHMWMFWLNLKSFPVVNRQHYCARIKKGKCWRLHECMLFMHLDVIEVFNRVQILCHVQPLGYRGTVWCLIALICIAQARLTCFCK